MENTLYMLINIYLAGQNILIFTSRHQYIHITACFCH